MQLYTTQLGSASIIQARPDPDDLTFHASVDFDLVDGNNLHAIWPQIVRATHPDFSAYFPDVRLNERTFLPLDLDRFLAVRCRAVSAVEKWGPNTNGDAWEAQELIKSHRTLMAKGFYVEHQSFDPTNAIGIIAHAEWIPEEQYVIIVALIDKVRHARLSDHIRDTLRNKRAGVSIGCIAGEAECSVCGNVARKKHQLCFVADTPITLASGKTIPIAMVKIGDHVVDADGNYNRVTHTFVREVVDEHLVDLKVRSKQQRIVGTCNHPFLAMKRVQLGPSSLQTIALPPHFHDMGGVSEGDLLFSPIVQGEVGGLGADQLRWLGWYASEGHVEGESSNHGVPYVVGFSLGNEDVFAEEITQLSERLFNRTPRAYRYKKNGISLRMSCKTAVEFALQHCGRGARDKTLSDEVMRAPVEWQKEFLAAYILGDGTVGHPKIAKNRGITKGVISIATASEQMAHQLCWMAERCGVGARMHRVRNQPGPVQRARGQSGEHVLYHVYLAASGTSTLTEQLRKYFDVAEDTRVTARQGRIPYERGWVSAVDDVKHSKFSGKVYNFEVDQSHTYLAGGVAVHNCAHMDRGHPHYVKGRKLTSPLIIGAREVPVGTLAYDKCRNCYFYETSYTKAPADQQAFSLVLRGSTIRLAADNDKQPGDKVVGVDIPLPDEATLDKWVERAVHDAFQTRYKKMVKDEVYRRLEEDIKKGLMKMRPAVQEVVEEKKEEAKEGGMLTPALAVK